MGKFWKLDVKMNQCYPKCGLGIFGGDLYLLGTLTDRHTARTERMRKKCLGMVPGEEGGYREGQGGKEERVHLMDLTRLNGFRLK